MEGNNKAQAGIILWDYRWKSDTQMPIITVK